MLYCTMIKQQSEKGFILLHRKLFDNSIIKGSEYCKGLALIDLFSLASHCDYNKDYNGTVIHLKRGQLHANFKYLQNRWGWSRKRVEGFFTMLKREKIGANERANERLNDGYIITLYNYDTYQGEGQTEGKTESKTKRKEYKEQYYKEHINKELITSTLVKTRESDFEDLWNFYDKKSSVKKKAKSKFLKLSNIDFEELKKNVQSYIEFTPEKQYRKNLETYLYQEIYKQNFKEENATKTNERNNKTSTNGIANKRDYGSKSRTQAPF